MRATLSTTRTTFLTLPAGRCVGVGAALLTPGLASANAFLPTMLSAGIVGLVAVPLVILVEAALMWRWGWAEPIERALTANALSTLAALPVGAVLSVAGWWTTSSEGRGRLSDWGVPADAQATLAQVLLYGQAPTPAFGHAAGNATLAGVLLAALAFMVLCGLVTVFVEGAYLRRGQRALGRWAFAGRVLALHAVSYGLLAALWLPLAYLATAAEEDSLMDTCSMPSSWSSHCEAVWARHPETLSRRLQACAAAGKAEVACRTGSR